jgi:hypothetical protein
MANKPGIGCVCMLVVLLVCVQYYQAGRSKPCTRTLQLLRTPTAAGQYIPEELESILVCITVQMNVGKA